MDPHTTPEQPDLAYLLPRDAYYHLVYTLRSSLPAPVPTTPESLIRRDNAAIAQVASLLPANASEATLAGQYVVANAHAIDCLQEAREPGIARELALKCRAQAASMMRQSQGAMRLLLRMQATRQKIEADSEATERAAWTEHCAVGLMAQALPGAPPAPVLVPEVQAEAAADPIAEAEHYAALYPQRAALIRQVGGVPHDVSFGPPEEYLVRALVAGRTPALLALDRLSA